MQTDEYFSKLPEHQQLLFEYLEGIPQTRGLHLIDVSTGGGKTYICLNYWCAEGHKHFRKLFFVLPQHKNIHSAITDFENSKQLTGYGGSYMIVKGVDCINDFLETNNSFHVLKDLRNQLLELEAKVKNGDSQQYNKLISLFNSAYDNIARLSDRCGDLLSDTGRSDTNKIDADLRFQLRILLASALSLNENPKSEDDCKANVKKTLSVLPALKEIYPIIEFFDYDVYFITAAKLMYELDLIVNPKLYFNNSGLVEDSLIIMDESDKDYEEMRKHLRQADLDTKPKDLFTMLDTLSRCLDCAQNRLHKFWEEEFRKKLIDFVTDTNNEIHQIYDDYHLARMKNIHYAPTGEIKRPFIFHSPTSGFVLPKQVQEIYLSTDEEYQCLRLNIEYIPTTKGENNPITKEVALDNDAINKVEKATRQIQLKTLVRRIVTYIRNVAFKLANFSQEYYDYRYKEAQRQRKLGQEVIFPDLVLARNEILSCFEIDKGTTEQLYKYILHVMGSSINPRTVPLIKGDNSFYNQGAYQIIARRRFSDSMLFYTIDWDEISSTPEKCLYNLVHERHNTIILLSATGRLPVCSSNFCLEYLKNVLKDEYHELPVKWIERFDTASAKLLPTPEERIIHSEVLPVLIARNCRTRKPFAGISKFFRPLFPTVAWRKVEQTLSDLYDNLLLKGSTNALFYMNRYYHFCFLVHRLIHEEECYSGIYFCNNLPRNDTYLWHKTTLEVLAEAIASRTRCGNPLLILNSANFDENLVKFKRDVSNNLKRLVLTSYNTTSIGMNLVHQAPPSQALVGKLPAYWIGNSKKCVEKDIDLIACQDPTNYRAFRKGRPLELDDNLDEKESIAIFHLQALYYTGRITEYTLFKEIQSILSTHASLYDNNYEAFQTDLNYYKLKVLKQAVGRICRRSIKGTHTNIYVEQGSLKALQSAPMDQSYGVEFRTLIDTMKQWNLQQPIKYRCSVKLSNTVDDHSKTVSKCRQVSIQRKEILLRADSAQQNYDSLLELALSGYSRNISNPSAERSACAAQRRIERLKDYMVKHPTLAGYRETRRTRLLYFDLGENTSGYSYKLNQNCSGSIQEILPEKNAGYGNSWIDENEVMLPQLMRSPIVLNYFKERGFATTWKKGHLFLPPQLLKNVYQGKIGEEALKAILIHLFPNDRFVSFTGSMYELADLHAEKRMIAFDAKHYDPNDYPKSIESLLPKLRHKVNRIKQKLVIIRILGEGSKPIYELDPDISIVDGLIHAQTGELIYSSVEYLRHVYEQSECVG